MAKRVAPEEKPYSPVQEALAREVLSKHRPSPSEGSRPASAGAAGSHPPAPLASATAPDRFIKDGSPPPIETAKKRGLSREKRMLLTREEERELDRLIGEISDELGVRIKVSNVLRASVTLLFNSRRELVRQCRHAKLSKRPRNSDPAEIANFEESLARIFDSAVRNTRIHD